MWAILLDDDGPTGGFYRDESPFHGDQLRCYGSTRDVQ
jgi:hypothetical protein